MRNISCAFLFILPMFSCNRGVDKSDNNIPVIDVAGAVNTERIAKISEIAESIEYIPLETNEKSFLPGIGKNFIYEDSVFFIGRKLELLMFDLNGNYTGTINRLGRGPGEYLTMNPQVLGSDKRVPISTMGKIMEYDREGNYICSHSLPENSKIHTFGTVYKIDKNCFVYTVGGGNKDNIVAIVTDSSGTIKNEILPPLNLREYERTPEFKNDFVLGAWMGKFYRYKNSLRIAYFFDDYILSINNNHSVDTVFRFNYGPYRMTPGMNDPRSINGNFLLLYLDLFESSGHIFMQFRMGALTKKPRIMYRHKMNGEAAGTYSVNINCSFYDKQSGKFTFIEQPVIDQIGFVDDLAGGPAVWPQYISEDNYMISHIDAATLINYAQKNKVSDKLRGIASKLKEDDNPVLVRVKLKK